MIVRAMGLGFLLWLAVAAVFRFAGPYFFLPAETPRMLAFIAAPIAATVATFVLLKLLKEARGDEGEAAIGLALPGMLLNAFACYQFASVFPALDPALASAFGAWALLFGGSILFMGLVMTQLAPQDERI
jgi:uncharacterized protein DUF5367